jgi:hypothetical protein
MDKMIGKFSSTEKALISRGVSSELASDLFKKGLTFAAIRSMSIDELSNHGVPEHVGRKIQIGRPPIPPAVLLKLLLDNKWTCCVCRNSTKPVVIHHIRAWATSKSHDETNLCVLCADDHVKAHTQSELAQNLTPEKLQSAKREWESKAKHDDSAVIRTAAQTNHEYWYFFNLLRLEEIAAREQVNIKSLPRYSEAKSAGILTKDGSLIPESSTSAYAYSGRYAQLRYWYAKDLFFKILENISIENVSDRLDRSDIGNTIITNDLIFVQGRHSFQNDSKTTRGPGQEVRGSRAANSIRVEYSFDRWYATSSSAHSNWLSKKVSVGSFCRVGSICREDNKIVLKCTVLAICQELPDLQRRSYVSPTLQPLLRRRSIEML